MRIRIRSNEAGGLVRWSTTSTCWMLDAVCECCRCSGAPALMTSIARIKRQITIRGLLKKAISISYLVVLSPSLPLEFSRKGSLLYYNPLAHQLSRNESLAGVTIGADTCRGGTARSGDERAVSDIRSRADDDLPVMGLIFCSLAISVEASCHSLVMVLGGAGAEKRKEMAWRTSADSFRVVLLYHVAKSFDKAFFEMQDDSPC